MNFGFTSGKARQSAPTKKWTEREIQAKIQEFDAKIEEAKEREAQRLINEKPLINDDLNEALFDAGVCRCPP